MFRYIDSNHPTNVAFPNHLQAVIIYLALAIKIISTTVSYFQVCSLQSDLDHPPLPLGLLYRRTFITWILAKSVLKAGIASAFAILSRKKNANFSYLTYA